MTRLAKMALLSAALMLVPGLAVAEKPSLGQVEYEQNCAICHGLKGKGDGPLSGYLERSLPDLTKITQENNGVFPASLMMEIIDGRQMFAVHGTRDMPAWGNEYNAKAAEYYFDYRGAYNAEAFIRARVLALTDYIHQLQAKK